VQSPLMPMSACHLERMTMPWALVMTQRALSETGLRRLARSARCIRGVVSTSRTGYNQDMTISAWPVVGRRRVIHAYKPGETSTSEGPFRTLRGHHWASPGVRVTHRAGRRLVGQMTLFSCLNVESARLARHGNPVEAARVAHAAAELEAGPEFAELQHIMSALPDFDAKQVLEGVLPEGSPKELTAALNAVARLTEQWRVSQLSLATLAEVITGRISEVHEGYVILVPAGGPATALPRWMAVAAQRDKVGSLLALVTDKLDGGCAVVEAVPAIDIDATPDAEVLAPFSRKDPRVLSITESDERLLAGKPQPLRVLVPVLIEE
jgi:hypothetical protein